MLFNSFVFLLCFLPLSLLAFHGLKHLGRPAAAKVSLLVGSVLFYAYWEPKDLILVAISVLINYGLSLAIERRPASAKAFLIASLLFNLGLLGWFKYGAFFATNLSALTGAEFAVRAYILPLAISFYTFQQIAYIIEVYRDRKAADNFVDYCLFVMFFPHLIAGPITHHKEMLPQFAAAAYKRIEPGLIATGIAIFIIGLAKKMLIADPLAQIADPVFAAADRGDAVSLLEAWAGALSYTFQLYFDFSGYSDMAIGLGLMFGVRLPVNFVSPYKATSIIDFWRRWHVSLSRFLRNYLYIPLGGSRSGHFRRYFNLFITMVLGGLWHGAGWTFLAWGALHGAYLMVNHAFDWAAKRLGWPARLPFGSGWAITFLAVIVAWVLFRASTFSGAMTILSAMTGQGSSSAPPLVTFAAPGLIWIAIAFAAAMAFFMPNSAELTGYAADPDAPHAERGVAIAAAPRFALSAGLAAILLGVAGALAASRLHDPGVFLYFNF